MKFRLFCCVPGVMLTSLTGLRGEAPADIPGLVLWLDASDASTIDLEGGQVAEWRDRSGNGHHARQDDPFRRPAVQMAAIGGKTAIRFDTFGPGDPESDGMSVDTALDLQRPNSVFIVDKYWGDVTGRTLQGVAQNWLIGKWNGNHGFFAEPWVGNRPAQIDEEAYNVGISAAFSSTWGYNGAVYGGANLQGAPGNLQLGVTEIPPAPPFDEPSQADVAEVIVFDRALGQSERERVEAYLAAKYSLPARLNRGATRIEVFTGGDDGEGLDFAGTFVRAIDVGGPGGFAIGDATFTDDTGIVTAENQIPVFYAPAFGATAADTALNTLMQSIRWSNAADGGVDDMTITVPGLSAGRMYKLQLLFGDTAAVRHWNVSLEGDLVAGNFGPSSYNRGRPELGTVLTHRFVAGDDTLDILFSSAGLGGGDINPILQALTLEDEGPSSVFVESKVVTGRDSLDFSGTFHSAVNALGFGTGTIGDATFVDEESAPNVTISAENFVDDGAWSAPEFGDEPEDDLLEEIFRSIRWALTATVENNLGIEIRALNPGEEYQIQLFFDEASNPGRGFDISVDGVKVLDDFATVDSYNNNEGQAVVLRYKAAGETSHIALEGYASPFTDRNPILAGLTVESLGINPDTDGDGLPDAWETEQFGNLAQDGTGDPDGDGHPNLAEYLTLTNPNNADTDGDGLQDGAEVAAGSNPLLADTDGDGLTDGDEVNTHHTSPLLADTDFDGIPDATEVTGGTSDPTKLDSDNDGYSDFAEIAASTDPTDAASWPKLQSVITNFSGGDIGEGLDLEGTFLYAVNVGGIDPLLDPPPPLPTVRGVAFDYDDTLSDVFLSATNLEAAWGANGNFGTSAGDVALKSVLQSIRWSPAPEIVDLQIGGLDPGVEYKLQLIFYEACCAGRAFGIYIDSDLVVEEYSTSRNQGPPATRTASMLVHHFVATSSSLSVMLDGNEVVDPAFNDHNPILNAFTLEVVGASDPGPDDGFVVRDIERSGNSFTIEFPGESGKLYAIDYKESLDDPAWTEVLDNIAGTAGSTTATVTDAGIAARATGFFRVRDTALKPDP